MKKNNTISTRRALSAEEFSALFRRDPENERLYRESEIRLDLAERMTEMRRVAGLSQQQLADRVGRKQPFIARLEKGGYDRCGLSTLRTFARAMGHDLNTATMFVQASAAHYTGRSSCGPLESSFEAFEEHAGKLASISLAAWERADLATSVVEMAPPVESSYAAA